MSDMTDPTESLWAALTSRNTQRLIDELRRAPLNLPFPRVPECDDQCVNDPEPRVRHQHEIDADNAGIPCRGEI